MDNKTTIYDLEQKIKLLCEERDWDQFHNPKDLAIGISTEANELLDIFRFKTNEQMVRMFQDSVIKVNIEDEIAEKLLTGEFTNGQTINVSLKDSKLHFTAK